uniref:hypothetical protein n=1 Tax=Wolbachia endosymbiont (group B) of Camptogramma bilineatum TaxID=2953991 RepID=UPI00222E573D|nr:hypothetical protein [Wolbachia endosymbiont (group B) of Camptogramma bilineatum]
MPQKMKVSNQNEYNKFLKKGGIFFVTSMKLSKIGMKIVQKCRAATIFIVIKL